MCFSASGRAVYRCDTLFGMPEQTRIALTGFMGVGKSSVARHLAKILGAERADLDHYIEQVTKRRIADIITEDGIGRYREIESEMLRKLLAETSAPIVSLGGGTWISEENREIIRQNGITTVWLESTFEHCWQNIRKSRKERPLAKDRETALKLFEERQAAYCLADWHFIVRPGLSSFAVANQIVEEIF